MMIPDDSQVVNPSVVGAIEGIIHERFAKDIEKFVEGKPFDLMVKHHVAEIQDCSDVYVIVTKMGEGCPMKRSFARQLCTMFKRPDGIWFGWKENA